jgi:hypothetical protein
MATDTPLVKVNLQSGDDSDANVPLQRTWYRNTLSKRWKSLNTKHPDSDLAASISRPWAMTGMSNTQSPGL